MAPGQPQTALLIDRLKRGLADRNRPATNSAVEDLLRHGSPLGKQWSRVAQLMLVSGELGLARRCMDAYVTASNASPMAAFEKATLLGQGGFYADAQMALSSVPDEVPNIAAHAYLRGITALALGQSEDAKLAFQQVIDARPGAGPAWLSLSAMANLVGDPLADRLLAAEAVMAGETEADRARYYYALGNLHTQRGDCEAGFNAFARGAALMRTIHPYQRATDAANAREAMAGFTSEFLHRMKAWQSVPTARPIFVTGLPRSGTTLIEQILVSHSAVAEGAELNLLPHVAMQAGGVSAHALDRYLAGGGSLEGLAELYFHLLDERFGSEGRIVDKTVDNSRFLGLIAAVLPDAPLIWVRRYPLDCAWSCFRTFFTAGVSWSYDLQDLAHHFRLEDGLCAFWQDQLGDRLLVVPYGELVQAPADWTRRLLAHCGLAEEAGPFAPHKTQRTISTASLAQVRRPINKEGLGTAEPYRARLQPFIDAYRDCGD